MGLWTMPRGKPRSLATARAKGDGGYHSLLWLEYAIPQTGPVMRCADRILHTMWPPAPQDNLCGCLDGQVAGGRPAARPRRSMSRGRNRLRQRYFPPI